MGRCAWLARTSWHCRRGALNQLRGGRVAMLFQQPHLMLDPTSRVGVQVAEPARLHAHLTRLPAAQERVIELLREVGIPEPRLRARAYSHELSGGMAQRVILPRPSAETRTANRRRADHRPGRHGAGPDLAIAGRGTAAPGPGHPPDHPRPGSRVGAGGSGGRHVRGPDRRGGPRPDPAPPPAPVYASPDPVLPTSAGSRRCLVLHRRRGLQPAGSPVRVSVPPALPGRGRLGQRRAGAPATSQRWRSTAMAAAHAAGRSPSRRRPRTYRCPSATAFEERCI